MTSGEQAPRRFDTILTGLVMGESARWHAGQLWVADWGTQEILVVHQPGTSERVASVPTAPCCFDWLPNGCMLVVSGQEGLLLKQELDGSLSSYANLAACSPYPWNEVAVDGRGNAYVNTI
jgi:sugar lactone lactonase YvrE